VRSPSLQTCLAVCALLWTGCTDTSKPDADGGATDCPEPGATTGTGATEGATAEDGATAGPGGCQLPADPQAQAGYELTVAFDSLTFERPIFLTHAGDGTGRLFVVEQTGRVRVFPNAPQVAQSKVFLDLAGRVTKTTGEGGLLGLAFHPDYANNGRLFVDYTTGDGPTFRTVVSEWQADPAEPDRADPDSEKVLLEVPQPYGNHNGGMVAFGPDGFLYIGLGDGGSANDPKGHGQDTRTLLGSILRVDVDSTGGAPYGIPAGNPFADHPTARPEIYAYGLRNPWRFAFDEVTGTLWAGDVGQGDVEEVDLIVAGGNYGWNVMEGTTCFQADSCDPSPFVPPVLEYPHGEGKSVTGGLVYRGEALPDLYGAYLFADYESRKIWTYRHGEQAPGLTLLTTSPSHVPSFGEDEAGEVYVLGMDGRVRRLTPVDADPCPAPFPQTLPETGCFADTQPLEHAAGVIPYRVNHPFWSDTAAKERYFALPPGATLSFDSEGRTVVPEGTVFIKHFLLTAPGGELRRVETRLLALEAEGAVRGYSYRWDDAQSGATLLASGDWATYAVSPDAAAGETEVVWQFPSRSQCASCHTPESGGVLGFRTEQLAGPGPGGQPDQLAWFVETGAATGASPPAPAAWAAMDDPDATLDQRARSYLASNCGSCHHAGGASGTSMDLRATTPLSAMEICGVAPARGDLGIADALLLAPGDPARSVLLQRMTASPEHRMPPIGSSVPHAEGAALIHAWIASMPPCP
jgi:uncharacterized repeat protein (TIGR03806 family)